MKLKLTRRQFGQLAVAGTAAAVLVFANKTVAQQPPNSKILGARVGSISDDDTDTNLESNTTDLADGSATADIVPSSLQTIVVESFDVGTQEVTTVLTTAPILQVGEQLSGFVSLKDGRLVVAATNINTKKKKDQDVRLIFLKESQSVPVSGLKNNEAVQSLVLLKDGSVAALVGKKNGKPPSRIVTIDVNTGKITDRDKIPEQKRVTAIAQCPDQIFYGIETEPTGETNLFQVGKEQSKKLKFKDLPWNNGFNGLVCTSSNQLIALGGRRYEYPRFLHFLNKDNGEIQRIEKAFDVDAITVA